MKKMCIVSYVLDRDHRVRSFPSQETMDRWIRKFEREQANDHSWINYIIANAETLRVVNPEVRHVRFGE